MAEDKKKKIKISEMDVKKIEASGGEPLPATVKHYLETKLKADFSDVRIHTGSNAKKITNELNARAYTHGTHIMFNSGEYQPHTEQGKHLLAHELKHVAQERAGVKQTPDSNSAAGE